MLPALAYELKNSQIMSALLRQHAFLAAWLLHQEARSQDDVQNLQSADTECDVTVN